MIKLLSTDIVGDSIAVSGSLSLDKLKQNIIKYGKTNSLPIIVELDSFKLGKGFSSFLAKEQQCVVIYNSEHKKDYHYFAITTDIKFNRHYLSVYSGGMSKNYRDIQMGNFSQREIGMAKAFGSFIKNKASAKYQEENIYYELIKEVIKTAVEVTLTEKNDNSYESNNPFSYEQKETTQKHTNDTCQKQNNNTYANNEYSNNACKDVYQKCIISKEQAKYGCEYTLYLNHSNKNLKVKIPAEIKDGHTLRLKGQGILGGNVYLTVNIQAGSNSLQDYSNNKPKNSNKNFLKVFLAVILGIAGINLLALNGISGTIGILAICFILTSILLLKSAKSSNKNEQNRY